MSQKISDETIQDLLKDKLYQPGSLASISKRFPDWFYEHDKLHCAYRIDWPVFIQSEPYWLERWGEWCVRVYQQSEFYGAGGGPVPIRFLGPQGFYDDEYYQSRYPKKS